MTRTRTMHLLAGLLAVLACGALHSAERAAASGPEQLRQEVLAAERAFAKTMADRDHAAFATFLADEAIFFSGEQAIRGRDAVAAAWKPYFDGPQPPFSWEPDSVHVLESGTLAMSSGPVRDPEGKVIARFNSVWRREAPGVWRVVFDKGCNACR